MKRPGYWMERFNEEEILIENEEWRIETRYLEQDAGCWIPFPY
jgi:hypothetical protein